MAPSSAYVEECLRRLEEADTVGFDVETSGLDWTENFIVGYVFTFGTRDEDTYYLPVRHQGGGNIPGCRTPRHETDWTPRDAHPLEKRIKALVEGKRRVWYAHNAKFDLHMAAKHDIWLYGEIEDTQIMAALLDENQGRYALEVCCAKMGVTPKVSAIYEYIANYMAEKHGAKLAVTQQGTMGHFWKLPADGMASTYAKGDGISMSQLREAQLAEIAVQDLGRVFDVEKRVTRALFRMERRGVPVNLNVLDRAAAKVKVEYALAIKALPEGLNVKSPIQVRKLYESMGFTMDQFKLTDAGNASFDEFWLADKPLGQEIIDVRKLKNLDATFLQGAIRDKLVGSHIYTTFNQLKMDEFGVVTGRLSCSDPNFQQIPKRNKKLAPLLRQIFRDPDLSWWSGDYSQQEYRVFAEYARARYVLEAYAKDPNADYHQLVADLLGVERDPAAKRINLGVIYNMGAPKLAASLGVELHVAKGYLGTLQRLMPEARAFNKTAEQVAKSRGFVRTLLGRRRRFPNPAFAHKAGNSVIQGSSADITKLKMAEIDEFLMGDPEQLNPAKAKYVSKLILQIHDSLEFLFCEEEREVLLRCMEIMENFSPGQLIELKVPMKVDTCNGRSWGHATFPKYTDWVDAA